MNELALARDLVAVVVRSGTLTAVLAHPLAFAGWGGGATWPYADIVGRAIPWSREHVRL